MLKDDRSPEERKADEQRLRERLEDALHAYQVPVVNSGVSWASQRLKVCDYIKRLERMGKSPIIDSFTRTGVSKGAHRAGDALHDPICGFPLAIREMGFKEACKKWPRHIASDVMTPMSLPLPGTFLFSNESWIVQMYSKGLLNLRSGVISPAIGVALTESEVRLRLRTAEAADVDLALQQAHLSAGAICLIAGGMMLFMPYIAPAMVVGFLASAFWHLLIASGYYVKRHSAEIKVKLKQAAADAKQRAEAIGTRIKEVALRSEDEGTNLEDEEGTSTTKPAASGWVMGIAAAALVLALMRAPSPSGA